MTDLEQSIARLREAYDGNPNKSYKVVRADDLARVLRVAEGQQWQPIETAPKNRTYVLLFGLGDNYLIARWNLGKWWSRPTFSGRLVAWSDATHWMPLPAAPKAAQ